MRHELKIEIQDIFLDTRFIKVFDWSRYSTDLELTNRVLKVVIPGATKPSIVELPKNDSLVYSSKSLKLSKKIEDLPDGLYEFTYSVCPNEKVFTKEFHFRTVVLRSRIYGMLAQQLEADCTKEVNVNVERDFIHCLLKLKGLRTNALDAYNVEKAYELYASIEKSLENIINKLNLR